jgi:hypothetical protein
MSQADSNGSHEPKRRQTNAAAEQIALAENVNGWCDDHDIPTTGRAEHLHGLLKNRVAIPLLQKVLKGKSRGNDDTLAALAELMDERVPQRLREPRGSTKSVQTNLRTESALLDAMPLFAEAKRSTPQQISKLAEEIASNPEDRQLVAFMLLWFRSI